MKHSIRSVSIIAALIFLAAFSALRAEAQNPGGYFAASAKSNEVVKAAKFAVRHTDGVDADKYSYKKVLSAEWQVVAGMNYRMCVRFKKNGVYTTAMTVVYRDLNGAYSLTGWELAECGLKPKA